MSSPEETPDTIGAEEGTRGESFRNEEEQDNGGQQEGGLWSSRHQNGDMKRAAAQLIEKYYFQLTDGCGNPLCDNPNCASSGKVGPLSSNEAAGKALQLFAARAKLCEVVGAKMPRSSQSLTLGSGVNAASAQGPSSTGSTATCSLVRDVNMAGASNPSTPLPPLLPQVDELSKTPGLTEETLYLTITECRSSNNYAKLRRLLWAVFSNEVALRHSFLKNPESEERSNETLVECKDLDTTGVQSKEELRALEKDLDKDLDCAEVLCVGEGAASICDGDEKENDENQSAKNAILPSALDIGEVRRAYASLFECPEMEFGNTLMNAIVQLLSDSLSIQLRAHRDAFTAIPNNINIFIILIESPALNTTDFIEGVMPKMCRTISQLPEKDQALLVKHLATWEGSRLHRLLASLHQLITIKLLTTEFSRDFTINDEDSITSATQVMKLLFYASILGGELDTPLLKDLPSEDSSTESMPLHDDPFLGVSGAGKDWAARAPPKDSLGTELGIHVLDARTPLVPLSEFYDDFLSDQLEMDRDFAYYKAGSGDKFSFLNFPFILTAATKALGLYYDNRIRMYSERRISIYQQVIEGMPANPYLKLRIRRDHIIDDALVELEMVALENPGDLKKQMVVEFEGEQGIDEGGVSKEFFQLIVEQIFNPDYAMFCLNNETRTFWFNPNCFESDAQFTLVGIVLGLAIYNNVILDVHFPPVMYKKLCSKPGSFHDLREWNPTLYRSLVELLEYEGEDMEDVFMQTFRVGYQDVFGTSLTHDLKTDGDNILVSQSSKHEFVELYADFLLNKMVERQFRAFRRGFNMVTDDSPLANLFRPEELELLVCGSQHYDFMELMKSAEYDGGYTSETSIIQAFWELVHDMSTEDKKKLLQFTTGSARVPVGGLARLKLIIARQSSDCDRLPTAHTCFNVLLLPEYSSKEKLKDRLYKAIKYSQGFGML
ncbi:ubiquitin-protein ligase E3A-like isoform X1 [Homarus americanus]|uniref:Ubiquitin-protein ligase E3A n=1 Tax=Homarus americanus TaxID=6706 RepID=A0A8J5MVF2_HOMAM|nr:ubiquitin-protein ligase E3A-like isoform X1 [Homarus americanus]KAG7164827.1 Ubiquitin-protein ligase E3A-like [Homarus americanus]